MKKPNIPDAIHHELLNWARWCWRGPYPHPLPPTHCGSPEWQYQRISEEGTTESVDNKPIPVNEQNAKIVQGVYDTLPLVQQHALRAEYPQRGIRVNKKEHEVALSVAVRKIELAFGGVY